MHHASCVCAHLTGDRACAARPPRGPGGGRESRVCGGGACGALCSPKPLLPLLGFSTCSAGSHPIPHALASGHFSHGLEAPPHASPSSRPLPFPVSRGLGAATSATRDVTLRVPSGVMRHAEQRGRAGLRRVSVRGGLSAASGCSSGWLAVLPCSLHGFLFALLPSLPGDSL